MRFLRTAAQAAAKLAKRLPLHCPFVPVGVRKLELHNKAYAWQQGGRPLKRRFGIDNDEPAMFLRSLQEVADLNISVAVVTVLHFAALAKQCVSLVKEKDRSASRSFCKEAG